MHKYIAEFIGAFFLVLTIGCTVMAGGTGVIPPLAIGSALMVMVYAGGHISGGHFNPAVTIGVWLRGRCSAADVGPYIGAQLAGGAAAAYTAMFLRPDFVAVPGAVNLPRALTAEALFTFALVYVVLNVATSRNTQGNSYFGLAIGFTVLTGAFAVGDISGGAFNPAVRLGATLMGLSSWPNFATLIAANVVGGIVAAMAFKAMNPEDK